MGQNDYMGVEGVRRELDGMTDDKSGMGMFISGNEKYIHDGDAYFVKTFANLTSSGTVAYFGFSVPTSTELIHAKYSMTANSEFVVKIYEGAVYTSSGIAIQGKNCNRNSTNAPDLQTVANPVLTSTGSLMWSGMISSINNGGIYPSVSYEIIPKFGSNYIFEIVKQSSGTHWIDFDFFWTEERLST